MTWGRSRSRGIDRRWMAVGAVLLMLRPGAQARMPFVLSEGYIGEEVPAEIERSYERGLRYLMAQQTPQGTWRDSGGQSGPGIDGLCLLAFAASGTDLRFGPYASVVRRGVQGLLAQQNPDGYFGPSMYHHGFATLALAELYGMVDEPRIGPALERAVQVILDAQKRSALRAWRYSPQSTDADATVSGGQMVALFAARNAGLAVPESAIEDGLDFFRRVQGPDGGIGYSSPGSGSGPRNAIAVVVSALAKQRNTRLFQGAWSWLTQHGDRDTGMSHHYLFYYLYYAAQAHFHADPDAWRAWNRRVTAMLLPAQNAEGGWDGPNGPNFTTAAALLTMALNYRYLPIYER